MNMENNYAQALYRMLAGGMKSKEAVTKLRAALERQGRASLLPKIGRAFSRIAMREGKKNAVTLYIARDKDEHGALSAAKGFLEEMGVAAKDVEVKTDENLIGGWRLEGREHLVDASFKKHLLSIYNRATT